MIRPFKIPTFQSARKSLESRDEFLSYDEKKKKNQSRKGSNNHRVLISPLRGPVMHISSVQLFVYVCSFIAGGFLFQNWPWVFSCYSGTCTNHTQIQQWTGIIKKRRILTTLNPGYGARLAALETLSTVVTGIFYFFDNKRKNETL